jgi:hypothetical protein
MRARWDLPNPHGADEMLTVIEGIMKTSDERVIFQSENDAQGRTPKRGRSRIRNFPGAAQRPVKTGRSTLHAEDMPVPTHVDVLASQAESNAAHGNPLPFRKKSFQTFFFYAVVAVLAAFAGAFFAARFGLFSATPDRPSGPKDEEIATRVPSATETMANRIEEIRKFASEESESNSAVLEAPAAPAKSAASLPPVGDRKARATTPAATPATAPCTPASLALALCDQKPN